MTLSCFIPTEPCLPSTNRRSCTWVSCSEVIIWAAVKQKHIKINYNCNWLHWTAADRSHLSRILQITPTSSAFTSASTQSHFTNEAICDGCILFYCNLKVSWSTGVWIMSESRVIISPKKFNHEDRDVRTAGLVQDCWVRVRLLRNLLEQRCGFGNMCKIRLATKSVQLQLFHFLSD